VNIIDFIRDKNLIGQKLSIAQTAALKAFYGLELSKRELDVYKRCTGLEEYHARPYREATLICGRRSGKSDRIASNVALFEALQGGHERHLSMGEKAYIIIISVNKKQAGLILSYVRGKVESSRLLSSMVAATYAEEIHFRNNIVIGSYPCSYRTLRGFSIPLAIVDEAAFLRVEGQNVDKQILEAIRPAQATFANSKLVKISTPFWKQGVLWEDFKNYYADSNAPVLVWRAPTKVMNPTVSNSFLRQEERRDPDSYKREYLAEFSDSISDFLPSESVDACVIPERKILPYHGKFVYTAAVDVAFKSDAFTFGICHRDDDGRVIFDYISAWHGTKKEPVNLASTLDEICRTLRVYHCGLVHGDQYCSEPVRQGFRERGITFLESPFSTGFKREIFSTLKHRIMEGSIELLDHPDSIGELKGLEARVTPSGNIQIGHARLAGRHDDFAVCIALAAFKCGTTDSFFWDLTGDNLFRFEEGAGHA